MGIDRFFSSVESGKITGQAVSTWDGKTTLDGEILMLDFNSTIHTTSKKVVGDLNNLIYASIAGQKGPKIDNLRKKYPVGHSAIEIRKWADENLDDYIVDRVIDNTMMIIGQIANPKKLTKVYIAIDGVPSKAKMDTQRHRRVSGAMISKYKKIIVGKYDKELANDPVRSSFMASKISWGNSLITPGTEFLDAVYHQLIDPVTVDRVTKLCPKLTSYTVSGPYEPGEGEKKIVNLMHNQPQKDARYLVVSPDSDMVLLLLLLMVPQGKYPGLKKLQIIRENQQKKVYNFIDVTQLSTQIVRYVNRKTDKPLGFDRTINETVLLFTVFGNDFLPRIVSFDVRDDFELILTRYAEMVNRNPKPMINLVGERWYLDLAVLTDLFGSLRHDEGGQLQRAYLSNRYKNYRWLRQLIGADAHNFFEKSNEVMKRIREVTRAAGEKQHFELSKEETRIFAQLLRVAERDVSSEIKRHPQKLRRALKLHRSERSIEQRFFRTKLEEESYGKPTALDRELTQFEYMLDQYRERLQAFPVDIGRIAIDTDKMRWDAEKVDKGVARYYYDFFKIEGMNRTRIDRVVHEYIKGVFWVFHYYYNEYDDKYLETGSTWCYPHTMSPLLTQIHQYLQNQSSETLIKRLIGELKEQQVPRIDYFNALEQLMYVIPANYLLDIIPKEYHDFVSYSKFYPDLDRIAADFHHRKEAIDCRGQLYLNKCLLKLPESPMTDQQFIRTLRRIKLDPATANRQGNMSGDLRPFTIRPHRK